jgi:hypothetical protein
MPYLALLQTGVRAIAFTSGFAVPLPTGAETYRDQAAAEAALFQVTDCNALD